MSSFTSIESISASCATALEQWLEIDGPREIEDAVVAFVPKHEPARSEVIDTLLKALKIQAVAGAEADLLIGRIAQAVSIKVAMQERNSGRLSVASCGEQRRQRMSADDTLDLVKVVLVGDSGVGKSCLMLRFAKGEFVTSTRATIGMDFAQRQVEVNVMAASEQSVVQSLTVQVWDTAGQEQFRALTSTYYRKAGGVMVVYDATKRSSFENVPHWLKDVDDHSEGVVKMVVAAKAEGDIEVSAEEGAALAARYGSLFATTSAKSSAGVLEAFQVLGASVLQSQEAKEEATEEARDLVCLAQQQVGAKKSGMCC